MILKIRATQRTEVFVSLGAPRSAGPQAPHRPQPTPTALQAQPRRGLPSTQQSLAAVNQPRSPQQRDIRPQSHPRYPHQTLASRRSPALHVLGQPRMRPRGLDPDDGGKFPQDQSIEQADPSTRSGVGLRSQALRPARSPRFARANRRQFPRAPRGPRPHRARRPVDRPCRYPCARPWAQAQRHHLLRPTIPARPRGAQRARLPSNPTHLTNGNQGPAEESVESGFRAPAVPSRLQATRRVPGRGQHEPPHHPIRMGQPRTTRRRQGPAASGDRSSKHLTHRTFDANIGARFIEWIAPEAMA